MDEVCLRRERRNGDQIENLDGIRRNAPNVTSVSIVSDSNHSPGSHYPLQPRDDTIWLRGMEALRSNTFVTTIRFDFQKRGATTDEFLPVHHVVQNRRELTSLALIGVPLRFENIGLCDRLILSASQNLSIRVVSLRSAVFSAESLLLLLRGTGTSLKLRKLEIRACAIMHSLEATPEISSSLEFSIANAAENNSTLTDFTLAPENASGEVGRFVIGILNGLARSVHSILTTLELRVEYPSVDLSRAIQGLLQSTTASALRTLRFDGFHFTADNVPPLAHGLSHSVNASTLKLARCTFDEESTRLFEAAFQADNHSGSFRSLHVNRDCYILFDRGHRPLNPLGPSSQLKRLELTVFLASGSDVAVIMQAVGRSQMLEFLHLTEVCPGDKGEEFGGPWDALAAFLPGFVTLRSLHFTLAPDRNSELYASNASWSRFVEAVQKNSSLVDVVGLLDKDRQLFTGVKFAKLARYCERNKVLSRLRDSNHSLIVQLVPSLATTVRRCEYGTGWTVRMLLALDQAPSAMPTPQKRRRSETE